MYVVHAPGHCVYGETPVGGAGVRSVMLCECAVVRVSVCGLSVRTSRCGVRGTSVRAGCGGGTTPLQPTRSIFENQDDLYSHLISIIDKKTILLVKGSRSTRMDLLADKLKE